MKNVKITVSIFANGDYGQVDYIATTADMSSCGYVKVGEAEVSAECIEPDFEAIKQLKKQRDALVDSQKAEIVAINKEIAEAGI